MTTFTRDPAIINAEWTRIMGSDRNFAPKIQRSKYFFALTDPSALLLFEGHIGGLCDAGIYADPNATGADKKDAINRGFRWVFQNTPAFVMRGFVSKDNAAMIAMAPNINGIFLAGETDTQYVYKITLASLAKHYGISAVVDGLRAAGRNRKADKLQAAYDAWIASQP